MGAVLRYGVGMLVMRSLPESGFPYGTLTVNLLGCLAIGALAGLADARQIISPELRLVLVVGLLGGFTTFSTFAMESVEMLRSGLDGQVLLSVLAHVVVGFTAVSVGYAVMGPR